MPEISELERGEYIQGWIALMQNQGSLVNGDTTVLFTLLFGYLLAAHFVGRNLSKPESLIFTSLYIVTFLITLGNLASNVVASIRMQGELISVCPECEVSPLISMQALVLIALVDLAMLIASLYFMWSIRNRKTPKPL
ncbi:MAG: hypothetical protein V7754_23100 [Halioglobus sp.]